MNLPEPPFLLDAAQVLAYAPLDFSREPRFGAVACGISVDSGNLAAVALLRTLADDVLFLAHCNASWETLAAEPVADEAAAHRAAAATYGPVLPEWIAYRALTPAEAAEIRSTRAFLRELTQPDP